MVAADAAEAAADGPGEPVLQRCGSPGQSEELERKKSVHTLDIDADSTEYANAEQGSWLDMKGGTVGLQANIGEALQDLFCG